MKLEELPGDVLHVLAEHLCSVHDYRSLLLASPAFHHAVPRLSSRLLALLASKPASKGLQPFMLTALAYNGRRLAHWARQSPENRASLLSALGKGQPAVLGLTLSLFPLTTFDLVQIRKTYQSVLLPTVRYLRTLPDMASARSTIGFTIIPKPFSSLQKVLLYCIAAYWAYCELFHHNAARHLEPESPDSPAPLDLDIRHAWVAAFVTIWPEPKYFRSVVPPYESKFAEDVNECRRLLHRSSCLMLSLTCQRCVLVIADEILNRLRDGSDDWPELENVSWGDLYDASGALRMLGLETMKWLLATKPGRANKAWSKTVVEALTRAVDAGRSLQEWNLFEVDLQHRADSLHYPALDNPVGPP